MAEISMAIYVGALIV